MTNADAPAADARRQKITRVMRGLRTILDALPTEQVEDLATQIEELVPPGRDEHATATQVDRAVTGALRAFAARERLLDGALTAPEVARLLHVSRQTPHDRVQAGTLLAILDRGIWRFPVWQFDANAPGGVLAGLPVVINALGDMPSLSKISWIVSPKSLLPDTPLKLLQRGRPEDLQEVLLAARTAVIM